MAPLRVRAAFQATDAVFRDPAGAAGLARQPDCGRTLRRRAAPAPDPTAE